MHEIQEDVNFVICGRMLYVLRRAQMKTFQIPQSFRLLHFGLEEDHQVKFLLKTADICAMHVGKKCAKSIAITIQAWKEHMGRPSIYKVKR